MALMDTRYPAYEVLKNGEKISYMLYRLEPDRRKGLLVREDSKFGLFGNVTRTLHPAEYRVLKKGQKSRSGFAAESDLYLCLREAQGAEIVYRFTASGHLRAIVKYLDRMMKK